MPNRRLDAVVFDVGGVLIDWNPRYLYARLFDGDEAAMERFLSEVCSPAWNAEQDRGRPWDEAIAELVGRHPGEQALIRAYRERWPEMIAGSIPGTVALVRELDAAGIALYALTNFAADTFALTRQRFDFFALFEAIVVSGEERVLKPDRAIFEIMVERAGADPGALVFVDDTMANVAGAAEAGLAAVHFTSPEALRGDLRAAGLVWRRPAADQPWSSSSNAT